MLSKKKVFLPLLLLLLGVCIQAIVATATTTSSCDGLTLQKEEDCVDAVAHPDFARNENLKLRLLNGEDTNSFWLQRAKQELRDRRHRRVPNVKIAKNIILFLGDGMGLTTIAAARNLVGGEEQQLSFEKFPHVGFSKTYSLDQIVPDSASTATAYLCGVKGNDRTIGFNGLVEFNCCDSAKQRDNRVQSIAKWAMDAGKAAGLVTTASVTDASPAAVYAHVANRAWQSDVKLKADCGDQTDLKDIALQLMDGEVGSQLKVILGGGKAKFNEKSARKDGRIFIQEFKAQSTENVYVETLDQLQQAHPTKSKRLLGLFDDGDLKYHLNAQQQQQQQQQQQPTLEHMTKKALDFMANEEHGYFLFIEGGLIDKAHHGNQARRALDEALEFSKAIATARKMTSDQDTLIVVTADHSHAFSIAGYQTRGSDIFDVGRDVAKDNKQYLALSYANGPSFKKYYDTEKNARRRPEKAFERKDNETLPSTVPLGVATHSGEDVPVFASGPWAHLFSGVYEQNVIPHLMAYAACVGDGLKACT